MPVTGRTRICGAATTGLRSAPATAPRTSDPAALTASVPHGKTESCRDWTARSARYRTGAPTTAPTTTTSVGLDGGQARREAAEQVWPGNGGVARHEQAAGIEHVGGEGGVPAQDGAGGGNGNSARAGSRAGGLGASDPRVARWPGDIRTFFPTSVVRVMQHDAIDRPGLAWPGSCWNRKSWSPSNRTRTWLARCCASAR